MALVSSSTADNLPDEIWRLIAAELENIISSKHRFFQFLSVNRSLFNYVLDKKYGDIQWAILDQNMVKLLKRLQEPIIACHVRRLHIRAWFINYLLQSDAIFRKGVPDTFKDKVYTKFDAVIRPFRSNLSIQRQVKYEAKRSQGDLGAGHSSTDILNSMMKAVYCMTRVVEFNFEWRDLPLDKDSHSFLTAARATFNFSLRRLVLRAEIAKFKELLVAADFENVDELDFHFGYQPKYNTQNGSRGNKLGASANTSSSLDTTLELEWLLKTVTPFIEHRKSSLRALSISSSSHVDLSKFFDSLPTTPNLRRLALRISIDASLLSDPSSLLKFLQTHTSSLYHFEFRPNVPGPEFYSTEAMVMQKKVNWNRMAELLLSKDLRMSNLYSIEMPFLSRDMTLPILHRTRDTLTRVVLIDHYLRLDEINALLDVFAHRPFDIKHLRIEAQMLDVDLISLLAKRLPGLYSLLIVYKHATPIEDFASTMNPDIRDWKLTELSIYGERYKPAEQSLSAWAWVNGPKDMAIGRCMWLFMPSLKVLQGCALKDHGWERRTLGL